MKKKNKILYWFIGTFLVPPVSWLLSAWFFDIWNTSEMFEILLRINIPAYMLVAVSIVFFVVKHKIKLIEISDKSNETSIINAQKSASFIPKFFLLILPIYTSVGNIPVLLPLDFIDMTEFFLAVSLSVPIVFLFAIPFFIIMNKHIEEYTVFLPFSDKYKPVTISNKLTILFLLSVIGLSVFYIAAVLGIIHNNPNADLVPLLLIKLTVASLIIFGLTFLNIKLFKKEILKPIYSIKNSMFAIAGGKGDLTQRLEFNSRDELGEMSFWFNQFIANINSTVLKINRQASSFSQTGKELAELSEKIAQNANEQASTTEEISASMEEILSTIASNTEKAIFTESVTNKSVQKIKANNKIFMETIQSVSDISKKTSVITDISFQTNILSLNASIEAAKAGKAGKGFTIIAQEVRNLAEKSKIESDEISELSQKGQEISKVAGEEMEELIVEIMESAKLVHKITEASREQQFGVQLINTSLQQLSEITNENSSSAERMYSSAEKLSIQADQLKTFISVFKTG